MSSDRPSGSITGNGEWQWNRHRASDWNPQSDESPARRERKALEAELERKEQRLQSVIEQYERRLEEKDRQLARERSSEGGSEPSVRTRVLQLLR